jgi:hypothetical protein
MQHAQGTKKTTAREQLDGTGTDAEINGCRLERATARTARLTMTQFSLFWDNARLRHRNNGPKNPVTILGFLGIKSVILVLLALGTCPFLEAPEKSPLQT